MAFFTPIFQGITHLIAPHVCRVCGQSLTAGERYVCLGCLIDLPRTYIHRDDFNEIHRRLGHRTAVDRAAGWFFYKSGTGYANLLVDAKYRSLPALARHLGLLCAGEIQSDGFFDGIDALVPMPMHWRKRLRRGYNQASEICSGISDITGIPVIGAIRATKSHGVQSRHTLAQRYASIDNTLAPDNKVDVSGMHVLLVDDIITSGASCIEALRALSNAKPAKISVLCIGLTMRI